MILNTDNISNKTGLVAAAAPALAGDPSPP